MEDISPTTPEDKAVKRVATGEKVWCKCERCGDIQRLFQYTKYEERWIEYVEKRNPRRGEETVFVARRKDIGEKRGLCKECALFVNKQQYDARSTTSECKPQTETGAQT